MTCPRCGQEGGGELSCPRCGVIFAKLKDPSERPAAASLPSEDISSLPSEDISPGHARPTSFWRVVAIISLILLAGNLAVRLRESRASREQRVSEYEPRPPAPLPASAPPSGRSPAQEMLDPPSPSVPVMPVQVTPPSPDQRPAPTAPMELPDAIPRPARESVRENQILGVTVAHEASDSLALNVEYTYTGEHGSPISLEATALVNGRHSGHWTVDRSIVVEGHHVVRVPILMNPKHSPRSDEIEIKIYWLEKIGGTPYIKPVMSRIFSYEKTWNVP